MNQIQVYKQDTLSEKQRVMHKDMFDKVKNALQNGFYFEALFLEYSAIEGRLEVISGLLSMPCNKDIESNKRRSINISNRIKCIGTAYKKEKFLQSSRYISPKFWQNLAKWIGNRNVFMHGLLKNVELYDNRLAEITTVAENGFNFLSCLYNEAHRIKRLYTKDNRICSSSLCLQNCRYYCAFLQQC